MLKNPNIRTKSEFLAALQTITYYYSIDTSLLATVFRLTVVYIMYILPLYYVHVSPLNF